MGMGGPMGATLSQLANQRTSIDQMAEAVATSMGPVRERLRMIGEITDPKLQREALLSLRLDLPRLLRQVSADPTTVRVMERVIGGSVVSGLLTEPAESTK
jgi:hypothetical protein